VVVEGSTGNPATQNPTEAGHRGTTALLAEAVVEGVGDVGRSLNRGVIIRECERLIADGWTPGTISAAVGSRSWGSCHGGAVVAWLRDLRPSDRHTAAHPAPGPQAMCPDHPTHRVICCPECAGKGVPVPDYVKAALRQRRRAADPELCSP